MNNIEFNYICNSLDEELYIYSLAHLDKVTYKEEALNEFVGLIEVENLQVKHGYINKTKDMISNAYRENYSPITYVEV
ncbi:MAG: hypothetical protein Q8936_23875 [Bacillota bacterium]|nr:hypothetical protein [Bacillota bacterium]